MKPLCLISLLFSGFIIGCTPTYVPRSFGTLGGSFSAATDINNKGNVVGYSETEDGSVHAFLRSGDDKIDLGTLGGDNSRAYGINENDEIVGSSTTDDGSLHPFLWQEGVMIDLLPDPINECDEGSALAINNNGWVVGELCEWAVVWRSPENPEYISTLAGEWHQPSVARDINDANQITGTFLPGGHTFIYEDGTLLIVSDDYDTRGDGINNHGQVVGYKIMHDAHVATFHAFMFETDSEIDLGTLGGVSSFAKGINDRGLIVGSSEKEDGSRVPFVYDLSEGTMKELMSLGSGEAQAVNASGRIAGTIENRLGDDRAVVWEIKRIEF